MIGPVKRQVSALAHESLGTVLYVEREVPIKGPLYLKAGFLGTSLYLSIRPCSFRFTCPGSQPRP